MHVIDGIYTQLNSFLKHRTRHKKIPYFKSHSLGPAHQRARKSIRQGGGGGVLCLLRANHKQLSNHPKFSIHVFLTLSLIQQILEIQCLPYIIYVKGLEEIFKYLLKL